MLIDTHAHIAWGIDDGLETLEQAAKALQGAKQDGITTIVATPHFIPGKHRLDDKARMKERMDELSTLAKSYDIEILTGSEVFLNQSYMDMIEEKAFFTLNNSKYVLVEFDVRKDISSMEDPDGILHELKVRHYTPVIAHVERYFHRDLDLEMIKDWIARGYVLQVNRTSILGMHGLQNEQNAKILLKNGLVHVVASDAHRIEHHRICKLNDVYKKISSKYGKINADLLCLQNPMHMINNEVVERMEVKNGIFARVFGRGVDK